MGSFWISVFVPVGLHKWGQLGPNLEKRCTGVECFSQEHNACTAPQPVADPENFGGGGGDKNFKHKTSKIRMCCNQACSQKFAIKRLF